MSHSWEFDLESDLGLGRQVAGGLGAIVGATIWSQALSVVLGAAPAVAAPLAVTSIAASALVAAAWRAPRGAGIAALGVPAVAALILGLYWGSWAAGAGLAVAVPACAWLARRLATRLPRTVDTWPRRYRLASAAWLALALVTVVQVGRLSSFMANPELDWFLTTTNPFWAKHECLPAYFQGAELASDGDPNIYHAAHYPALNPAATPETHVEGMTLEDPFQYAPQFLLWPALGMALTHDYVKLKLVWFALQTTFFLFVALTTARWVGGRSGRAAALLTPLAFIAFPALHAFQYGQFHLVAVGLALLGMIALDGRRRLLGGALLAVAVLSKLFPGVLLVVLAAQRRWRDLGAVAAFGAALTAATVALFGTAPFEAFLGYHAARLASGAAFAFGDAWPELRELVLADNQGFYGLTLKLGELGVPGMTTAVASWINRAAAVGVLALALWTGHRTTRLGREARVLGWFGLLALASMLSTGAFGDYVPATATWMATFVAYRMSDDRRLVTWLVPAWALQFFLVGTTPIGDWFHPTVMMALSATSVVAMAALSGWVLRSSGRSVTHPAPQRPTEHQPVATA